VLYTEQSCKIDPVFYDDGRFALSICCCYIPVRFSDQIILNFIYYYILREYRYRDIWRYRIDFEKAISAQLYCLLVCVIVMLEPGNLCYSVC
jgi:hypothetical protein